MVARGRGVIAAVVLGVPLLVGATPTQRDDLAGLADGAWRGQLIYDGRASFPDAEAQAFASGSFDMTVAGGVVTGGSSNFEGTGASQVAGGASAQLGFTGVGTMTGTALQPTLSPASATLTGSATVGGVEVPIELTLGPGELNDVPLEVLAVTCEEASGDFTQVVVDAVEGAGGTGTFYGYWVAVRTPPEVGDFPTLDALERLFNDLLTLRDDISDGVDPGSRRVSQIALDATDQLSAIDTNEACRELVPGSADYHLSATATLVREVLEAALANPDTISNRTFRTLVTLGVMTGLLLPGVPEESRAPDLDGRLLAEAERRFELAAGPPVVTADAHDILLTALMMNWPDLAEQAREALR